MELSMNADEYHGLLKYLLSKPMGQTEIPLIADAFYWKDACQEVLGSTRDLRSRVSIVATKAHLDSKGGDHYV